MHHVILTSPTPIGSASRRSSRQKLQVRNDYLQNCNDIFHVSYYREVAELRKPLILTGTVADKYELMRHCVFINQLLFLFNRLLDV